MSNFIKAYWKATGAKVTARYSTGVQKGFSERMTHLPFYVFLKTKCGPAQYYTAVPNKMLFLYCLCMVPLALK